jgi:hypothetical protein
MKEFGSMSSTVQSDHASRYARQYVPHAHCARIGPLYRSQIDIHFSQHAVFKCETMVHNGTQWKWGTRWRSWLRHRATSRKLTGSTQSFRPHYGPRVDLTSNKNEYQEYFLGGKGGRCVGLTVPPSCADCLEIWQPQPPGSLWACTGP